MTRKATRLTVRQLNQDAGNWLAFYWVQAAEKILANGMKPAKLSTFTRADANHYLPEWFWEDAHKSNRRWWLSERNWKHVHAVAMTHARLTLTLPFGAERYPLTVAHFSTPVAKA